MTGKMEIQIRHSGRAHARERKIACPELISLANAYKVERGFDSDLSLLSFLNPFVFVLVSSSPGIV